MKRATGCETFSARYRYLSKVHQQLELERRDESSSTVGELDRWSIHQQLRTSTGIFQPARSIHYPPAVIFNPVCRSMVSTGLQDLQRVCFKRYHDNGVAGLHQRSPTYRHSRPNLPRGLLVMGKVCPAFKSRPGLVLQEKEAGVRQATDDTTSPMPRCLRHGAAW